MLSVFLLIESPLLAPPEVDLYKRVITTHSTTYASDPSQQKEDVKKIVEIIAVPKVCYVNQSNQPKTSINDTTIFFLVGRSTTNRHHDNNRHLCRQTKLVV